MQDLDAVRARVKFLDMLSAYIVVAGGQRISVEDLEAMPFGKLLDIINPLRLHLGIAYEPHLQQPVSHPMLEMFEQGQRDSQHIKEQSDGNCTEGRIQAGGDQAAKKG